MDHALLRRRTLLTGGLLAVLPRPTATADAADRSSSERRVEVFDLSSGGNGGVYRVFLVHPVTPPPPSGFPVLTMLDGNATVPLALKALPQVPGDAAVIVGVGYPVEGRFDVERRYLDLTPPTAAEFLPPRRGNPIVTGGRDAFRSFLETEVMAAVEARVPVDRRRRWLYGHSLGGLFVLHMLFRRSGGFQGFIAADPSVWWNGRSILDEMAAFIAGGDGGGASILIETSGTRPPRPGQTSADAARMEALRSGPDGRDVAAALARVPGLGVDVRHFPEETHGSLIEPTVADALRVAFGRATR
ncbi:alpha/beta hydrolase [Azospirillum sp. RWY-5-1]|uniref:Alpha/beta hydrolase n=1 Tax=Azospirillum oleiclasticum TaxID=2735135 RepID=A0ABX2T8Y4_9PROT|nr:alpha/beta hydrolase-fold protein [Azospirillum oleiclasticum]NYZ13510.1 alpha/beta hydrolase [Azospirillum oleiclasticum]NYZ20671.1 alpha/beta hydrolase [Azospirillum oleiclasticum]